MSADTDKTIFVLSKADVIGCAKEMGIPETAITDEVLDRVKDAVECWSEVVKEAINMALKS